MEPITCKIINWYNRCLGATNTVLHFQNFLHDRPHPYPGTQTQTHCPTLHFIPSESNYLYFYCALMNVWHAKNLLLSVFCLPPLRHHSYQPCQHSSIAELLAKVHFEKMGAAAATTQRSNQATTVGGGATPSNLPGVASRFGYRGGNIVRPASAGLTQHYRIEVQENGENNNYYGSSGSDGRSGGVGVNGQQKPLVSNCKWVQ